MTVDTTFFNPNDFVVRPYCDWCKGTDVDTEDHDHDWEEVRCNDCGGGTEFSGDPTRPEVIRTTKPDLDALLEFVQHLREATNA